MLDRSFVRFVVLSLLGCSPGLLALSGCSSKTTTAAPVACDSSKCAPDNQCIAENGVTVCRRVCSSQTDPQTGCPANYTCRVAGDGTTTYCSKDNFAFAQAAGQWGTPCKASGGLGNNPDCDTADQFWCYGTSPSDANAYCTQFQCTTDQDCAGGFYCGDANVQPNVTTSAYAVGQTQKVCLRRDYCAPCTTDVDCPVAQGTGAKQHCVSDAAGDASYCTPECAQKSDCNDEAGCAPLGTGLPSVCVPFAGACVGDGSLCAPCRSDADCPQGSCVKGEFTTERFCSVKSPTACSQGKGTCPTSSHSSQVLCTTGVYPDQPDDLCVGTFKLGGQPSPGCYTPPRG